MRRFIEEGFSGIGIISHDSLLKEGTSHPLLANY